MLSAHADEHIRQEARHTLRHWDERELERLLSSPSISPEALAYVAAEVLPEREALLDLLVQKLTARAHQRNAGAVARPPSSPPAPGGPTAAPPPPQEGEQEHRESLLERISRMSVPEKIQAALLGSSEERIMLVRDTNKAVARAVLSSPKLNETEVEAIASMKTVAEEVLRAIAQNRAFMRHYPVAHALVNNSRAPIDVTLPLVARLNSRDLKALAVNHNVASALRQAAEALCRHKHG